MLTSVKNWNQIICTRYFSTLGYLQCAVQYNILYFGIAKAQNVLLQWGCLQVQKVKCEKKKLSPTGIRTQYLLLVSQKPYPVSYGAVLLRCGRRSTWRSTREWFSSFSSKALELQSRYLACSLPRLKRPRNNREFGDCFLNGSERLQDGRHW